MRRRVWLFRVAPGLSPSLAPGLALGLALSLALGLALGGCATGSPSGPSTAGAPPKSTSGAGCPSSLNLNSADNGKTVCVTQGGSVLVQLLGTPGQDWAPLQVSPAQVLTSVPTSVYGPSDLTYGSYQAAASGTAEITSSRSACPPPAPGSVACHAIAAFRVTVTVR